MERINQSRSAHWRVMRFVITPALLAGSAGLLWVASEQLAFAAMAALVAVDLAVSVTAGVATVRGFAPRHAHAVRIAVDMAAILGCRCCASKMD